MFSKVKTTVDSAATSGGGEEEDGVCLDPLGVGVGEVGGFKFS